MFGPWLQAAAGGVLIGLAAGYLLWSTGKTAGVSGMVGVAVAPRAQGRAQALAFLGGLLGVGALARVFGLLPTMDAGRSLPVLAFAGLLVGFGTRWSNGCTSGHGICGIGRGSIRSIVATATFMLTGAVTVGMMRWLS